MMRRAVTPGRLLARRRLFSTQVTQNVKQGTDEGWSAKQKVGLVLFGSLVAGTACLGVWQSTRYFWKVEQIELRKQALAQEPSTLTGPAMSLEENRRYKVRGKFLHDKELRVGPRSPPKSMGAQAQGLGVSPQGHYIITPLQQDDGTIVLVNRGWVPLKGDLARPTGPVEVVGVVSEGEKTALFTPTNDIGSGKLLWVDVGGIQEWLGRGLEVQSYLIETAEGTHSAETQSAGTQQRTWPLARRLVDLQDFYVMPSTHLVYAVTWFSLSAFGAVATRRLLKNPRPPVRR